tara:strand:- start:228 stop:413 length:186 start_codon:yes stop_codon:yes gene_type:complete
MENLKLDIIRRVMMVETKEELQIINDHVRDAICREGDLQDKEQEEFEKWKKNKSNERGEKR